MTAEVGIAATILVAVITAVGGFVTAARRFSGKIATSDATELWQESKDIRTDYRERLNEASERQSRLEARVAELEHRNTELAEKNVKLLEQQVALQADCAELRDERDDLRREVENLKVMIGDRRASDRRT